MIEPYVPQWFQETLGLSPVQTLRLAVSLLAVLTPWLVRRLLLRAVERRTPSVHARYRWRKTTTYLVYAISLLFLVRIWFHGFTSLSTMVGLISAGVAIALKDPLVNLAGWLFILWRQPFGVGDRIEIGGRVAGDVIDLRIFSFTLMEIGNWVDSDQSTGRIIHVPNGRVFSETVANYSRGFRYIWDEIGVLVTFESDWRGAKKLLEGIINRHAEHLTTEAEQRLLEASKKFMIFYNKLTPIVYTSVKDSGVMLSIRYLTEPQARRGRRQAVWEDILTAFAERNNIDFAYPTQRVYLNAREGKAGTRAHSSTSLVAPPDPNDGYLQEEPV